MTADAVLPLTPHTMQVREAPGIQGASRPDLVAHANATS